MIIIVSCVAAHNGMEMVGGIKRNKPETLSFVPSLLELGSFRLADDLPAIYQGSRLYKNCQLVHAAGET